MTTQQHAGDAKKKKSNEDEEEEPYVEFVDTYPPHLVLHTRPVS
jgi:hypothetical protein